VIERIIEEAAAMTTDPRPANPEFTLPQIPGMPPR
jgi:hypothetical protein